MSLSKSKLATALESMTPTLTAGEGEAALAAAYGAYMKDRAQAGAVLIVTAQVDALAVPAMAAAMTFTPGASSSAGATVVKTGLLAFWGAMVAAPALFFAGATAITPPSFVAVPTALAAAFDANTAAFATLEEAAAELADVLHPATDNQGTATIGATPYAIT